VKLAGVELKKSFESNGFSLSDNYVVWRISEKWNVINERNNSEIWKKDGSLNVYDRKYSGDSFLAIYTVLSKKT